MTGGRVSRCLLLAALAASPALASVSPVQQIGGDASFHRVEAVPTPEPSLRHTILRRDGTSEILVVPGTLDAAVDKDPALAIDPSSGDPVLVWSRDEGGGFDLWISRYVEGAWSTPLPILIDPEADELLPQVQVLGSFVHVVAHRGTSYVRMSLDRQSLQPAFGPEILPTDIPPITPGVDAATSEPPGSHVFFASDLLRPEPQDPGTVVIWGIRDEPVPIDYIEALALPADSGDQGATTQIAPIEGSLAVTVSSTSRIWYTAWLQRSWLPFGAVDLDASTSLSDVRSMLADMIRREAD